jgi:hypothetical protein
MVTLFVNTIAIGRYTMIDYPYKRSWPSADTADPEKIE